MRTFFLFLLMSMAADSAAFAQSFDTASVMALHNAGLGDDVIVAKIRTLPCNYDLSTDQLIALKRGGLHDGVIAEMVKRCTGSQHANGIDDASADPAIMHRPGIYLGAPAAGAGRMVMLRPTISSAVKTTGNGSILFPLQLKVLVPRSTSQMIAASARPTFWFYFDPSNRHVGEFGSPDSSAAESPDEFSLVRLRSDGVVRQFVVGRVQPYVSVSGIDAKHAIQFDTTEMSDGIFKVSLGADLEPGEYAFVLVGEKARKAAYRIYDFEVASAR